MLTTFEKGPKKHHAMRELGVCARKCPLSCIDDRNFVGNRAQAMRCHDDAVHKKTFTEPCSSAYLSNFMFLRFQVDEMRLAADIAPQTKHSLALKSAFGARARKGAL